VGWRAVDRVDPRRWPGPSAGETSPSTCGCLWYYPLAGKTDYTANLPHQNSTGIEERWTCYRGSDEPRPIMELSYCPPVSVGLKRVGSNLSSIDLLHNSNLSCHFDRREKSCSMDEDFPWHRTPGRCQSLALLRNPAPVVLGRCDKRVSSSHFCKMSNVYGQFWFYCKMALRA